MGSAGGACTNIKEHALMNAMKKHIYVTVFFILACYSLIAQKMVDSETDGRYVNVNGARLWVVTVGSTGDPLILIPGGPGGTHYGLRSFDSLSKNHTLIYFD